MMVNAYYVVMPDSDGIKAACVDMGQIPENAGILDYYYGFAIASPGDVSSPEDYMTELQVPVKKM